MLNKALIQDLIAAALDTGGDFAEVFVDDRRNLVMKMVGGAVEESVSGRDFGVAIRVFHGLNSIYAYTNDHEPDKLMNLARQAARALRGSKRTDLVLNLTDTRVANRHPIRLTPRDVSHERKVALLREGYAAATGYSPEIVQATVYHTENDQSVLIANSEGTFAEDRRVRTRYIVDAVASSGSDIQSGFESAGAHKGFEFYDMLDVKAIARAAALQAVTMLHADYCPAGRFPVIIANGNGGVIMHEACGHGLEATQVAKNASVFAGRLGEKLAPDIVTLVDDGTLPGEWGSQNLDDEGEPNRRNVLIENGVLKGYLIDKLNARRMQMPITGSSRRQSYKFAPTSRMTNTFIAPGKSTPEEIIATTEFAVYAKQLSGGSVNPASGEYNFGVSEAWLVENGRITRPVRGATLIGTGPDTLAKIDMVGNDLAHGPGMCGSLSGLVPVNCGQPTIRVSELTVGGRKER